MEIYCSLRIRTKSNMKIVNKIMKKNVMQNMITVGA